MKWSLLTKMHKEGEGVSVSGVKMQNINPWRGYLTKENDTWF